MKFYGNGIVWDAKKNKPLCKIKKELETDDEYIIKELKRLGYAYEKSEEKTEKVLTVAELKKIAKNKGVKGYQKMKKAELMEVTR